MKLSEEFKTACSDARQHVANSCGGPLVVTLEGMGYRVVPEWVADSFERTLVIVEEKGKKRKQSVP